MEYKADANPELASLGWMVLNPTSFERYRESIKSEVFSYQPARLIFEVLSEQWQLHGELPNFSEAQWLIKRVSSSRGVAVGVQAQTLQDLGEVYDGEWTATSGDILRRIVAESIVRDISEDLDGKPGEVILGEMESVKQRIETLDRSTAMEDEIGIFPFSAEALDNPRNYLDNLYKGTPVPTGLERVDADLGGGVSPGEVALVMAPFNVGKTMTMLCIAFHAWIMGYRVVYYSLDNIPADMLTRLWSRASQKIFTHGDPTGLADAVKAKIDASLASRFILKKLPAQMATVVTIERHIETIASHFRDEDLAAGRDSEVAGYPHLCVIDPPDKLACHERLATDKRSAITYIYQGMNALAEIKHMAIWATSQTNREGWDESFQKSRNVSEASTKMEEVAHAFGLGRSPSDARLGQGFFTCHKARRAGMKHKIYPLVMDDSRATIYDNRDVEPTWERGMGDGGGGGGSNNQGGGNRGGSNNSDNTGNSTRRLRLLKDKFSSRKKATD